MANKKRLENPHLPYLGKSVHPSKYSDAVKVAIATAAMTGEGDDLTAIQHETPIIYGGIYILNLRVSDWGMGQRFHGKKFVVSGTGTFRQRRAITLSRDRTVQSVVLDSHESVAPEIHGDGSFNITCMTTEDDFPMHTITFIAKRMHLIFTGEMVGVRHKPKKKG